MYEDILHFGDHDHLVIFRAELQSIVYHSYGKHLCCDLYAVAIMNINEACMLTSNTGSGFIANSNSLVQYFLFSGGVSKS